MSSIDDYSYIVQFIPFLRRWIGPLPGQAEARAMSWMSIVAGIVLCGLSLFYGFRGETFMGRTLGGDFAGFYVTGKILNEYEPARIYDMDLEIRLQHQPDVGMEESQMLPFAQAPYIGQLFRPFAKLPYRWAYVVWLGFSLIFYLLGLRFLLLVAKLSPERAKTGFLLGLSCMAFVIETWIGGQLSVVGFFLIAAFVYCRSRDRELLAGFVLSLALYKITLVAIPAFMLLCGRRWRSVFGFSAGAGVVASLSLG
ncbi:MAG: glycosyltransferase family 87 protein, partial [Bryobacteraceae bacterium]